MTPIFSEYCKFLKDKLNLELEEGYYWIDNQIIKAFDMDGNTHKLYRLVISDEDLSISYKIPKSYDSIDDFKPASWGDMITLNQNHLVSLEVKAKNLIVGKMNKYHDYTPLVPVSMGKDSQVVCHLVRECYPETIAIFNNTTLDCADTYLMAKKFPNCRIMTPHRGFYQYVRDTKMVPTRFSRFCCRIFKSGEMVRQLDHDTPYLIFMGMRNEESNTRSSYGDEWVNTAEWGNTKWQGILPIREWSELDVWLYTMWRRIEVNPKYRKGYSRVGCHVACPYYAKSTWVLDKYWYPKMRQRWENILRNDFITNNKWIVMNCTIEEYVNQAWSGGVLRDEPTPEVIKEFAEYNGLDVAVAGQYFTKFCANGCKSNSGKVKKIKDKETLSMNLKLHGRNTTKFFCKKCLMEMYGMDEEKWDQYVEDFKREGCSLF